MRGEIRRPLLVIGGPTGVGKTRTAVALAKRVAIEVIGADSRQVYRGMDAATGKPTAEERRAVEHHLIDIVDPDDRYQAARFLGDARRVIAEIRERARLPVVVGGTGLYIRALIRGLDPAPPADPAFREELLEVAAREGRVELHRRLVATAPALARRLHPNDHVRVIRALEIARAGGAGAAQGEPWGQRPSEYDLVFVGLTREREALARRLRARAEEMANTGLEAEVQTLLARGYAPTLPALQGIGYREFARVVQGTLARAEAIRLMQRDTVRYARRQWTWFAREPGIEWIDVEAAGGPEGVAGLLEARLAERGLGG
jgi:tRNA dimethylallyltransferase